MKNERLSGLDLEQGQMFGDRYRIVMPIGKGGMGRVYLAEDVRLGGKLRALKLTRPLPDERRTFLLEAELMSELDHTGLPDIVDYFPPDQDGVACIVMDYVAGDTLAERFERFGLRLTFPFVLGILTDLCEVLVYLHSRKPSIVFRDLKPSNVLLDRRNRAILVDFGIARRYREEKLSDTLQLGTPGFAAPEQLRGEQSDCRTDLYGLGALAYHLLTGGKFAIRHRGDYKRSIQEDVPAEFIRVLERILDSDPDRRPQTAIELLTELKIIQRGNVPLSEEHIRGDFRTDMEPVIIVAIASAYPGAGATFASMALSDTLARMKVAHALVECPGGYGELYALLNGAVRMPKWAIYSQAGVEQAAVPAWRQGSVAYYPLSPNDEGIHNPDNDYTNWLKRLGVPIVLLDVSSRWERSGIKEWLMRSADHIGLVADCFPAKWSHRRQLSCVELAEEASKHRINCAWLANRDQPFADRKNWLSLFPNKPEVSIPDIGSPAMINALWRGEGLPKDKTTSVAFDGAFRKWIAKVTGIR